MGNVPHLRFPEFSGEWNVSTIGAEFDLYSGNTPSRLDKQQFMGKVNWISSGELKEHYISSSKEKITEIATNNNSLKILPIGTFIIAIYGLEAEGVRGTCSITKETSTISQACMAFMPKGNVTNEFLYSWYKKHGNLIGIRYAQGTKQQNLSYDIISQFRISFPSAQEQTKLEHFISLLDERIATQNKIIEDLKKLKSAITDLLFHSIADAHTIRLGEIAHITNGAGDVQDANTEHQEDWYPFFDRSEELKWFPTYSFDKEAVIYAGEGQSFYPRYYNGKFALHQRCYAITDFASCIIPKYCCHFMNTLNSYFVRNSVGSTVPSLRMDIFQKVEIRLPPIPKQQHICKIIDAFYTKLEVEQRGISILQELKQFLLSQMFI
ncbi:restriction endonuclease subunit S [Bacteroides sp. MSB163]|uniref:restriction endonuclease subunit S n=1 Tax=Bacteroides maternus TaxID=3117552 RepID=UPI002EDA8ADE